MHLQNALAIIGIVLFIVSIVRGCGGMLPGGCGTGSRTNKQQRPHRQHQDAEGGAAS